MKSITILIIVLLPTLALAATVSETRHIELSAYGIHTLELTCGAGSLVIKGVDGLAKIHVTAQIEVEGLNQDELAQYIEKNVQLNLKKRKKKAFLLSEIERHFKNKFEARINIMVEIPMKSNVKISDGSGPIRVNDLWGNLQIEDDSGAIEVENIAGKLTIDDGSGSILIEDVNGTVRVKDGSGFIEVDNINGDVFITDGTGGMLIQHINGNVNVTDGSGGIDIRDVSQNVFIGETGSGELNIERIKGKITVRE